MLFTPQHKHDASRYLETLERNEVSEVFENFGKVVIRKFSKSMKKISKKDFKIIKGMLATASYQFGNSHGYDSTDFNDPLDIDWNDDAGRWC